MGKRSTVCPPEWTGKIIGRMHNARITKDDLAKKTHFSRAYITLLLLGRRQPKWNVEECLNAAVDEIIKERGLEL